MEHVTDEFLTGEGRTFRDALKQCIQHLITLMQEESKAENKAEELKVKLRKYPDLEQTAVEAINDIIFTLESKGFVPLAVENLEESKGAIVVKLKVARGTLCNPVKAATYHESEVKKNTKWKIKILVDV